MVPKITGIIIDQTKTEGKWYVREIKDGDNIKPMFFRRDKADLLGRLVDKLRGAESGQRYAVAHRSELKLLDSVELQSIFDPEIYGKPTSQLPEKFTHEKLQNLLDQTLASPDKPQDVSITTIKTKDKAGLKNHVSQLWENYRQPTYQNKQHTLSKSDFMRLMTQALQLHSKEMVSNDPKIKEECVDFVIRLRDAGEVAWKTTEAKTEVDLLIEHFKPAYYAAKAAANTGAVLYD